MEFDWNNPPFNLDSSLTLQEIEESFEDPFAVRVLPDSPRFTVDGNSRRRPDRERRIGDDYATHRSAHAGAHQAPGPLPVSKLSKHDQTMAERTNGTGSEGESIVEESNQ